MHFMLIAYSVICSITTETLRMAASNEVVLTADNINPQVIKMQYAVRGPIVQMAAQIEQQLKEVKSPFFNFAYFQLIC